MGSMHGLDELPAGALRPEFTEVSEEQQFHNMVEKS